MNIKSNRLGIGGIVPSRKYYRTEDGKVIDVTDYYGKPGYEKYTRGADVFKREVNEGYNAYRDALSDLVSSGWYGSSYGSGDNWGSHQKYLPDGYTIMPNGLVSDADGNLYVSSLYAKHNITPNGKFQLVEGAEPMSYTINQGRPIERTYTYYRVNNPDMYKDEAIYNVDAKDYYGDAVDKYVKDNTRTEELYRPFGNNSNRYSDGTWDYIDYSGNDLNILGATSQQPNINNTKTLRGGPMTRSEYDRAYKAYKNAAMKSFDMVGRNYDAEHPNEYNEHLNLDRISKRSISPSQQDINDNVHVNSMNWVDENGVLHQFANGGKIRKPKIKVNKDVVDYTHNRFPVTKNIDINPVAVNEMDEKRGPNEIEYFNADSTYLPYLNYTKPLDMNGKSMTMYSQFDDNDILNESVALDSLSHGLRDQDPYWRENILPKLKDAWYDDAKYWAEKIYNENMDRYGESDDIEHLIDNQIDSYVRSMLVDPAVNEKIAETMPGREYGLEDNHWFTKNQEQQSAWNDAYNYIMQNNDDNRVSNAYLEPVSITADRKSNGGHLFKQGGSYDRFPKLRKLVNDRVEANAANFGNPIFHGGFELAFHNDNYISDRIAEAKKNIKLADTAPDEVIQKKIDSLIAQGRTGKSLESVDAYRRYLKAVNSQIVGLEDAKSVYLGFSPRGGSMQESQYKPTVGDPNKRYYKQQYLSSEDGIRDYLMPAFQRLYTKTPINKGDITDEIIGKSGNNIVTALPVLGHATVGVGFDNKKGQYLSYYDKWDVGHTNGKTGKGLVDRILNPNEEYPYFYDRIYLDDYYGLDTMHKDDTSVEGVEYTNGWLPEITIKPNSNKDGGHLFKDGDSLDEHPSHLVQGTVLPTLSVTANRTPFIPRAYNFLTDENVRIANREHKDIMRQNAIEDEVARREAAATNDYQRAHAREAVNAEVDMANRPGLANAFETMLDFTPIIGDIKGLTYDPLNMWLNYGKNAGLTTAGLGLVGLLPGGDILKKAKIAKFIKDFNKGKKIGNIPNTSSLSTVAPGQTSSLPFRPMLLTQVFDMSIPRMTDKTVQEANDFLFNTIHIMPPKSGLQHTNPEQLAIYNPRLDRSTASELQRLERSGVPVDLNSEIPPIFQIGLHTDAGKRWLGSDNGIDGVEVFYRGHGTLPETDYSRGTNSNYGAMFGGNKKMAEGYIGGMFSGNGFTSNDALAVLVHNISKGNFGGNIQQIVVPKNGIVDFGDMAGSHWRDLITPEMYEKQRILEGKISTQKYELDNLNHRLNTYQKVEGIDPSIIEKEIERKKAIESELNKLYDEKQVLDSEIYNWRPKIATSDGALVTLESTDDVAHLMRDGKLNHVNGVWLRNIKDGNIGDEMIYNIYNQNTPFPKSAWGNSFKFDRGTIFNSGGSLLNTYNSINNMTNPFYHKFAAGGEIQPINNQDISQNDYINQPQQPIVEDIAENPFVSQQSSQDAQDLDRYYSNINTSDNMEYDDQQGQIESEKSLYNGPYDNLESTEAEEVPLENMDKLSDIINYTNNNGLNSFAYIHQLVFAKNPVNTNNLFLKRATKAFLKDVQTLIHNDDSINNENDATINIVNQLIENNLNSKEQMLRAYISASMNNQNNNFDNLV